MTIGGRQLDLFQEFAPPSILIVDSPYTGSLVEASFHTKEGIKPTVVASLESRILSQYSICIVSNKKELMSEEIQKNIMTPVLFIASKPEIETLVNESSNETLEDPVNRTLEKYNLFDMAEIENRFEIIRKALAQKQMLLSYLAKLPEEISRDLFQKTYDPPRFLTFFRDVRLVYDELEKNRNILPDDKQKEIAFNLLLIQKMREWNYCRPSPQIKKATEKEAVDLALEYLKQRESGVRKTPLLGNGTYSEESVDRLSTSLINHTNPIPNELRWRVARLIIDDPNGNDHKKIAQQRYEDSNTLPNSEFRTSEVYKPLHLDSSGFKSSFVLMQDIEGPTLDQVLRKINDEVDRTRRRDPEKTNALKKLRNALINKYVKDVVFWQTKHDLKTFLKKPTPSRILEDYYSRIVDLPNLFEKLAPQLFSEEEKTAYVQSLSCLNSISILPEDVVRIRDATLKNVVLSMDGLKYDPQKQEYIFSIDDLLRHMSTIPKSSSLRRIEKIFYHVDLHYRYGHILEDISHIITAQDSAFLLTSRNNAKDDRPNERHINSLLKKFLEDINRSDVYKDKRTIYLMFFYRSARKLKLYSERYIKNDFKEYSRGEITEEILKERLKTKKETMWHHARSCSTILDQLRRHIKNNTMKDIDAFRRFEDIHKEILEKGYNADTAKLYLPENLKDITDQNVLMYTKISALSLTFKKLAAYLKDNTLHYENVVSNGN